MWLSILAGTIADGTIDGAIQYAKDLEVEGLLVPPGQIAGFRERGYFELQALRDAQQRITDGGLSFTSMSLWPPLTAGAPETEGRVDGLSRCMEAMGAAGVPVLVYFLRADPEADPSDDQTRWDGLLELAGRLVHRAEDSGVRLALHSGGAQWDYEHLTRLTEAIPSPSNGITFCTGNLWPSEGERLYEIVEPLKERIHHVHLRNVRLMPGASRNEEVWYGSGEPDMGRMVQSLRAIGYQGDMSPEHLPPVVGENRQDIRTASAIAYMKAAMRFC
jgi:sugar phosphate isomerase/epimerase